MEHSSSCRFYITIMVGGLGGAREACGGSQKQGVRVAIKIKTSRVKMLQARSEHIKNRTGAEPQQR